MPNYAAIDKIHALSPANMTVFQAARLADNPSDLRYRAIFPRVNASSVRLSSITLVDFRPVGGRREWNAQPREVPENLGPAREFSMIPINFSHTIDEYMMQLLNEAGVQQLANQGIINDISSWPTVLADACERQIERDAFEAWFTGLITVKDTKTSASVTVDLGFGTDSYPTAGTDWDDPGEDAYERFLTEVQDAQTWFGGGVGAARTHRTVVQAIVADAPDGPNGLRPTISSLQDRVREEGFPNLSLVIDERTYDEFDDGGSTTTAKYYVPDGLIGFQPADGRVGNTHVAPVTRAYDFLNGGNRSLANGVVIFRSEQNNGETLRIEAQENALAMPEERRTRVVDTGIAR